MHKIQNYTKQNVKIMNRVQSYQTIVYSNQQQQKSSQFNISNGQINMNNYGLMSPRRSKEKKNLIDQIINKCQKIESPKICLNKCSQSKAGLSPFSRSKVFEDKENSFGYKNGNMAPNPLDRLSQRKKSLEKRNYNNSSRSSVQSCGKPNLNGNSATPRASFHNHNDSQEYYRKNVAVNPNTIHTNRPPIYRPVSNTVQSTVSPRKNIPIKSDTPGFYSSNNPSQGISKSGFYCANTSQNLCKKVAQVKKQIQKDREEHLEHCKNEERKLRLYYVELQNKLCEMRNKELQILAEYQASKLEEYDKIQKEGGQQLQKQGQKVKKSFAVKVNDTIKPQIQGCLLTGLSGILFSFDQSSSGVENNQSS